jgi:hypothetical protein
MKRWLGMVLVAAAVTAAAGCSSSSASPTKAVQTAIANTVAGGSVQENVSSVTPTASGTSTTGATGVYSFKTGLGLYTVNAAGLVGKLTAILSGTTLYVQLLPPLSSALPKGKAYVSVDLNHPPTLPGISNVAPIAGIADLQPLLNVINQGMTSVTKKEDGTVAGVPATHYAVKVDASKLTSPEARLEKTLLGSVTQSDDLWVSRDKTTRLVQLVAKIPLPGGGDQTTTAVYSGYGATVGAKVPDPSLVVDANSLLSGPPGP